MGSLDGGLASARSRGFVKRFAGQFAFGGFGTPGNRRDFAEHDVRLADMPALHAQRDRSRSERPRRCMA